MKKGIQQELFQRRTRNQELAAADALNRCGVCKRSLRECLSVYELWGTKTRYCSEACRDEAQEASAT